MDESLLGWKNIISLHSGAVMVILISLTGNSSSSHDTTTSMKSNASGEAESGVSSSQARSSWDVLLAGELHRRHHSTHRELRALLSSRTWVRFQAAYEAKTRAAHHSPGLLSPPALCFLWNKRNVGVWLLKAVPWSGALTGWAGTGAFQCAAALLTAHCRDGQKTLVCPCFADRWSLTVHFTPPCFDFHVCKEKARFFLSFKEYLKVSLQKVQSNK